MYLKQGHNLKFQVYFQLLGSVTLWSIGWSLYYLYSTSALAESKWSHAIVLSTLSAGTNWLEISWIGQCMLYDLENGGVYSKDKGVGYNGIRRFALTFAAAVWGATMWACLQDGTILCRDTAGIIPDRLPGQDFFCNSTRYGVAGYNTTQLEALGDVFCDSEERATVCQRTCCYPAATETAPWGLGPWGPNLRILKKFSHSIPACRECSHYAQGFTGWNEKHVLGTVHLLASALYLTCLLVHFRREGGSSPKYRKVIMRHALDRLRCPKTPSTAL